MASDAKIVAASIDDRPRERFDDASRGDASWFTFFSGEITPTSRMSAGVLELEPGGELVRHRHEQPEIYFVIAGHGVVAVDGATRSIAPGASIFIPGDAEHGLLNDGAEVLRVFYVFPTDRFSEVVYRF